MSAGGVSGGPGAAGAGVDLGAYRAAVRAGRWEGPTRAVARGRVQCNLIVLPFEWAEAFGAWCAANPAVAPVLARSEPGDPRLPALGAIDLRSDLPRYRVFRDGVAVEEVGSLDGLWRDDLVAFAFGCSFSLEEVLRRGGVDLAYERRGFGGAIYRTTRETVPAGPFAAPLVVSMRPLAPAAAALAVELSERYPQLHGAPVHVGDPAALGVVLDEPLDAIGAVDVAEGELPVFWACGVTPQLSLEGARPPLAITHLSAHMLVTDLTLDALDALDAAA
ncbi:DUF1445 domain-containing protein [Conexibacter sp. JD483]|uniref:D-glutamate cyclase family protein n=1 Tax=unclassified Conexibacter TaxID=2627773 RepID=UPI002727C3A7|nr:MULTISPECIES: DUF1445 domain-containing protein [unclassified Conexibacter]MDO8186020.1 DUF1445 domain-containing protein [Conexibacter sp. CPCC 205706]MDO8199510.1 DUF1445 domain-containing protein [Conexibacter sp. CPCC 205762]MDR9368955.1 DUF1445 domain-containing protein [Conexibacter sp. JD483]